MIQYVSITYVLDLNSSWQRKVDASVFRVLIEICVKEDVLAYRTTKKQFNVWIELLK